MAPNIVENKSNSCDEKKEAYWICFAFLVYEDIFKKEQLSLHDHRNVTSCLKETALDKYRSNVYCMVVARFIRCVGCSGAV